MRRVAHLLCLLFTAALLARAEANPSPEAESASELVQKYLQALSAQSDTSKGMEMDVVLDGRLPKLKKEGKMAALRKISRLGQITYKVINFWGDDTIKKDVIARYLTAETQAKQEPGTVAITPENYNFKYKGLQERADQQVHIFELKPKKKRVGLFKGELWIDPQTYLPLRESGRLVKNPSIFFKKVDFVREYEIAESTARTTHFALIIDTRVAGKAELDIRFNNYRQATDATIDEARASK